MSQKNKPKSQLKVREAIDLVEVSSSEDIVPEEQSENEVLLNATTHKSDNKISLSTVAMNSPVKFKYSEDKISKFLNHSPVIALKQLESCQI